MDSSPSPVPFSDIPEARTAYGRSTAIWADPSRHHVERDWWIALSLTPYIDYNLALVHGGSEVARHVLDEVTGAAVPALIMLAGSGLAAGDLLTEAGWVCTGALPFMGKDHGPAEEDPQVRLLVQRDLVEARRLAAAAFGVPEEVGAIVYAEEALVRPGARMWGLFEGDALRCCSVSQYVGDRFSVGWALSTAPEHQRSGYGRRLMRASAARRLAEGPPIALLMATDEGRHLYEQEGYVTLEHWQIWSRPRWMLR